MAVYTQERIGLIPQSIIRTLNRLRKQFLPEAKLLALEEFRISRFRTIVALQCFLILLTVPLLVNFFGKLIILKPLTEYFWNIQQNEIFLNTYQTSHALKEMKNFEEIFFFDSLIQPNSMEIQVYYATITPIDFFFQHDFQETIKKLAFKYNQQSSQAIIDIIGDFCTVVTIQLLFVRMRAQIIFLKAFLVECFYSLNDAKKSVFIFFVTDLLVGYHSPKGWQILTETFLQHYGLPEDPVFIKFLIAILPVLLDTLFKYWIFRHLNRVSPSTVVTYHALIE